jgi:hypothetical protein
MPRRTRAWLWVGRITAALCIGGLAWYLSMAGLDKADKLGSAIGAVLALAALVAPYLLAPPDRPGSATATGPAGHNAIDLRHTLGVQVNLSGGNTQNNTFTERP